MTGQAVFAVLAFGAGCCIALQAVANTRLGGHLGHPLSATYCSICGTIVTATAVVLAVRPPFPIAEKFPQIEWWAWVGGPLGVLFVLAGASLTRHLGAGFFVALVVAGQLAFSLAADHFGALGLPQQSLSPGRALGAALVVAGVVCFKFL